MLGFVIQRYYSIEFFRLQIELKFSGYIPYYIEMYTFYKEFPKNARNR